MPSVPPLVADARALSAQGQSREALALLDEARKKNPEPSLYAAMADLFVTLQMPAAAESVLREGLRIFPSASRMRLAVAQHYYRHDQCLEGVSLLGEEAAHDNDPTFLLAYGALLKGAGSSEKARSVFEKLLQHNPADSAAMANLAGLYAEKGEAQKAIALYRQALKLAPHSGFMQAQLAQLLLRHGIFEEGWRLHEARFLPSGPEGEAAVRTRPFPQPRWQGEKVAGDLLLWNEQGIGEEILAAGLLREARALCQHLIVECDARLQGLFARSMPDITFVAKETTPAPPTLAPTISAQGPSMSAAHFFRKNVSDFGTPRAYLRADEEQKQILRTRYEEWKRQKGLTGKVIGISWRSKPLRLGDPKSTQLEDWACVMEGSPHLFINLQYGDCAQDLAQAAQRGWALMHDDKVDQHRRLDDFAAQVAAMDAVISVSNTTAHMAGALGVPSIILLPKTRGLMWHWFEGRSDSPWYSAMRLLRQDSDGDWLPVLRKAAALL